MDVYKCLVVFGVFLSFFLQYGFVYGIGIYYVLIAEAFSAGATQVSLLCSIFTAVFFAISPVSSVLTNRFGCRPVHMAGGIIAGIGFITSSFVDNFGYLYFTFAVMAGAGLGVCGTPAIVIVTHHFKEKRALAYGIGLSGVGLGTFAFPQIVSLIIHHYDLRGALLLTGAICFHLTLCGAIFSHGYEVPQKTKKQQMAENKVPASQFMDLLQLDLFKDLDFLALSINCTLAGLGQSIVFVHIAAYAVSVGFSTDEAANVISVTGILNCAGRLVFGLLPLIKPLGRFCPFMTGLVLSGIIVSTVGHIHSYIILCLVVGAFGFLFGAFGALEPQVALEIVGERHLASAFGFLQVFVATGSLLGAPLAALLYESTSSYLLSFYLGGGAILMSGLMSLIPWWRRRCLKIHEGEIIPSDEIKIKPEV